jgi:hypothetical protein
VATGTNGDSYDVHHHAITGGRVRVFDAHRRAVHRCLPKSQRSGKRRARGICGFGDVNGDGRTHYRRLRHAGGSAKVRVLAAPMEPRLPRSEPFGTSFHGEWHLAVGDVNSDGVGRHYREPGLRRNDVRVTNGINRPSSARLKSAAHCKAAPL